MATALTTAQIVQKMYIGFYGRGADVDGLAFWVEKLGDSADTTAIRESFSTSTEAVTLFGGKTDSATVTAIYVQTFGRNPDASGLKFYEDALTAKTMTKAEIAANIIDGATGTDAAIVSNKLEVAEFAVLRGAQLSENCLHNLLNTKPIYFSEREQEYGSSNVNHRRSD